MRRRAAPSPDRSGWPRPKRARLWSAWNGRGRVFARAQGKQVPSVRSYNCLGLFVSSAMLQSHAFGKATAYARLVAHTLAFLDYLRQALTTSAIGRYLW